MTTYLGSKFVLGFGLKSKDEGFLDLAINVNEQNKIYLLTPYLDSVDTSDGKPIAVNPLTDAWIKKDLGVTYEELQVAKNLRGFEAKSDFYNRNVDVLYLEEPSNLKGLRMFNLYDNQVIVRLKIKTMGLKGLAVNFEANEDEDEFLGQILNEIEIEDWKYWSLYPEETDRGEGKTVELVKQQFEDIFLKNNTERKGLIEDWLNMVNYLYKVNG